MKIHVPNFFRFFNLKNEFQIFKNFSRAQFAEKSAGKIQAQLVSLIKSNYETNSQAFEKFNADLTEVRVQTANILEAINEKISKIIKESKTLEIRVSLDETAMSIFVHLQEIEHQIESLYVILSSLSNRQLHPLILSYPQVAKLVQDLPTTYPLNTILQDPFLLQQLASVDSMFSQGQILCKVSLPLIQKELFHLKKVYPLPMPSKNNISAHYGIPEDYLLTDDGANKFIPLYEPQLKSCKKVTLGIMKQVSVCHFILPLYTAPDNHCLLLLYKGWPEANQVCKISPILHEHNTVIKMVTENSWLYLLVEEITAEIKCAEFKTVIKLAGKGILSLKPNCFVKVGNILLETTNKIVRNVSVEQVELIAKHDFEFDVHDIPQLQTNTSISKLQLTDHQRQTHYYKEQKLKLNNLLRKIGETENERMLRSQNYQQTTHTTILIILAILVSLLVAIVIVMTLKFRQLQRRTNFSQKRLFVRKPDLKPEIQTTPSCTIANNQKESTAKILPDFPCDTISSHIAKIEESSIPITTLPVTVKNIPDSPCDPIPSKAVKTERSSVPITTPTVIQILRPEDKGSKRNVSDFDII